MKNIKGISLIVLVITIIVIIILAGSVILSLANNNPIEQASEATFKESVRAYTSELDLYNSSLYATSLGTYNPELLQADSSIATYNGAAITGKTNIYSIITSIKSDDIDFVIKKGKLLYKGTIPNELDWIEEVALENTTRPNLIISQNIADNKIHLEWNMNDTSQPYLYKIYQQKEGVGNFQSISTSNLRDNVKVLNIYPTVTTMITFTNWKGETFTLPKSASVKSWMELANGENAKGYGMGLIDVDCVSNDQFNSNPNSYLFDATGKYKYDVIYQGAWDGNGGQGFNLVAQQAIIEFIKTKRGFLTGHDTAVDYIRSYLNFSPIDTVGYYGGIQLKVSKKGLLTTYPWNIGDVGTILNIPIAHTQPYQHPMGDIWLQFYDSTWGLTDYCEFNFYLTTWNNTAMIQTGHSNGSATPDEQKILANTIFYLAQLTSQTYLNDNSGQDLKAPSDPIINSATINAATGKVDIAYSASQDLGSLYSYYVEAQGQNLTTVVKTGIKSTTITSGIAGYSVVVDTVIGTVPSNTVNTTVLTLSVTKPVGTNIYVHIKAIDNKGNVSNTVTLKAT